METKQLRSRLLKGLVIPACPLPLLENRQWSMRHQRAITRYYHAAGAGGIAVGVHSTQFAIRKEEIGLYQPVLELVAGELESLGSSMVRIAGICGGTEQAVNEAKTATELRYQAGLLSLAGLNALDDSWLIDHCRDVAEHIPLIGFYLQPAVGGRVLPISFWRKFVEIGNVVAIKIAPFNRYQTWDVVRSVIESGRDDIALYTGNDDNIIVDLLTRFRGTVNGEINSRFIDGGLLGQWGVWTKCAVEMLDRIKVDRLKEAIGQSWLTKNVELTDVNAALFDASNGFKGCVPGIMEMLRRVGLAPSNACLDPNEQLSRGQAEELDRVTSSYPQFVDDKFVRENLAAWLER